MRGSLLASLLEQADSSVDSVDALLQRTNDVCGVFESFAFLGRCGTSR